MAACEKCWADAFSRYIAQPYKSQAEHYQELLIERREKPCTPAQQKGPEAHRGTE